MARRSRRQRLPVEPIALLIDDLSHDGRGVGRHDGKVTFVHGALPGERVHARLRNRNRRFDEALTLAVETPSAERVEPGCSWFGACGGCAMQHLDHSAQLNWKQSRLAENFKRIGQVLPAQWLPPIHAKPWSYRRRARLSVRWVAGKGRVLVGFREIGGRFVADIERCDVLAEVFGDRLMSLSDMIGGLSIPDRIAQLECAAGDASAAIVLRHLDPLTDKDHQRLIDWSESNRINGQPIAIYLQPKGPDTVHRLTPAQHHLSYRLDEFNLDMAFKPQHFIQINASVNQRLIHSAMRLMAATRQEHILDLFCGLGNFSLPLARSAGRVTGIELDRALVEFAQFNAERNGIANAQFEVADLTQDVAQLAFMKRAYDGVLIDPPRSGAAEILPLVAATQAARVVYVSCDPATLARDAGQLVHEHGYTLVSAGIADMFPHTAHVESIALFTRSAERQP
ncbi:MAG: 23S rRNA (uracil(1939)-C(5))-methyltransferase RlmD [Pseudomonadota bacterium]